MTPNAILFTQCLQNDFVQPIQRFDPLPNHLHIGHAEARRLMGDDPATSPVARVMEWANRQPSERLLLVHIRDWHQPDDDRQAGHLQQFGSHCIAGTPGAEYAFKTTTDPATPPLEIQSLTLNDFQNTHLAEALAPYAGQPVTVGIMGVRTDAKVFLLAYELTTRFPAWRLAVCPALTASNSRTQHFIALEQMKRILGITVLDSLGDFLEFLGGKADQYPLPTVHEDYPEIEFVDSNPLPDQDCRLLRYLFSNCRQVKSRILDGGFSGNAVLGTISHDLHGHRQAPHVVKIGPRSMIGQERTAFERIEEVLGNSAPRISDFADYGDRGAIKYRYASMTGDSSVTFQKLYTQGLPLAQVSEILREVFVEQLGRLYIAARLESSNLLEYYQFSSGFAGRVREHVEQVIGKPARDETLQLATGPAFYNPCRFYEHDLETFDSMREDSTYFSYVHGDLNGANIILDSHQNVWLIDFFHTHYGHVLRDLIKLENDLLYIFTPIKDTDMLAEAMRLTDMLVTIRDLSAPVPAAADFGIRHPELQRTHATVSVLRSFYPDLIQSDRSALQWCIAAMRYAVHTLSFDESSPLQKQWALYTAGRCAKTIRQTIRSHGPLRIDWLDAAHCNQGQLGITLLPGRRDIDRDLDDDLQTIMQAGVTDILCCVPTEELQDYGVGGLLERYAGLGLGVYHFPLLDQKACTVAAMRQTVSWLRSRLRDKARVMIHCVGGLGRSGMVAACYLCSIGMDADQAISVVRGTRSPRAIETDCQQALVKSFSAGEDTG